MDWLMILLMPIALVLAGLSSRKMEPEMFESFISMYKG